MSSFGDFRCPVCKTTWTGSIGYPDMRDIAFFRERLTFYCPEGCGKKLSKKIIEKFSKGFISCSVMDVKNVENV